MQRDRQPRVIVRRADRPGDLGWVVMAHGEVYDRQLGWDTDFEALVARIVADYAADHDPTREAAWVAEVDGERAGCIFLVAGDEPWTAKSLTIRRARRRARLEQLAHSWAPPLQLTPQTTDAQLAQRWLADYAATPVGVEGIVIKQLSETYKVGKRSWQKLRIRHRTEAVMGAVAGPADALRLVLALPGREGQLMVAGMPTALSLEQSREGTTLFSMTNE